MSGWTDERVELLKKLWAEGLTGSQVAKQLGGVSRNSVIGKLHRIGLAGRAQASEPRKTKTAARTVVRHQAKVFGETKVAVKSPAPVREWSEDPGIVVADEPPGMATLATLGAHMCKWPIGDPLKDDFTYCGRQAEGPYCHQHEQIAHPPPAKKKAASANELMRSLRRYL